MWRRCFHSSMHHVHSWGRRGAGTGGAGGRKSFAGHGHRHAHVHEKSGPLDELTHANRVLGVSHNASLPEIKDAFRHLAKQWHPDLNRNPGASQRFKEINEAYHTLQHHLSERQAKAKAFGTTFEQQGVSQAFEEKLRQRAQAFDQAYRCK